MRQRLHGLDIVIAEDDLQTRVFYKSTLEAFGARRIREAVNGQEAYSTICEAVPEMLLTDYAMSPLDGIELTRLLRDKVRSPAPFLPILMITAYTVKERIRLARDAGVQEVLHKPVTPHFLVEHIARIRRNPLPYIQTRNYFGPDRRRAAWRIEGPERRSPTTSPL
jgi:two-component system chemotaxis response regulator CheY